jgi:hypothetical protein
MGYFWLDRSEDEDLVDNKGFLSHRWGFSWGVWLRLTNIYIYCPPLQNLIKKLTTKMYHLSGQIFWTFRLPPCFLWLETWVALGPAHLAILCTWQFYNLSFYILQHNWQLYIIIIILWDFGFPICEYELRLRKENYESTIWTNLFS